MKRSGFGIVFIPLLFFFAISPSSIARAQPSIAGSWIFDMSGMEKGGAVINFGESSFNGYGYGLDIREFTVKGNHTIDSRGVVKGDFEEPEPGVFTGKVDKKAAKMTVKVQNGPTLKGTRLPPHDPGIPEDWIVNVSGGGAKGTLNPFTILPDVDRRFYVFEGTGIIQYVGVIHVEGFFFLTGKNAVYGEYWVDGATFEMGVLSGKMDPASGTFKIKTWSIDGSKHTLSGVAE